MAKTPSLSAVTMNEKQLAKFKALHALLVGSSEYYLQAAATEQAFVETTIGAAVFYLPQIKSLHYSGLITPEALESGQECLEHMFPRKIAGMALLTTVPDTIDDLIYACNSIYLRYNIVTPKQNKMLTPFQKKGVFTTPTAAYEKAGIELIKDPRLKES